MKNRNTPFTAILFVLAYFALLPGTHAVNPPPDGGYARGNTAEGTSALFSLTTGLENTAVGDEALADNNGDNNSALGHFALFRNTTGSFNTAIGDEALFSNSTGSLNIAIGKAVGDAIITAENVICIGSNFPGANVSNS